MLFANAGIAKFAPVNESTEALFDETFDVNVKGVYFAIQKALPLLNDGASIIINSSVVNETGAAGASVYAATKAAVRSFARTLTTELVDRNIRVNVVSPGPIQTPIFGRTGLPKEAVDEFARAIVGKVPMKRFGKPEEVADAVLFLENLKTQYHHNIFPYPLPSYHFSKGILLLQHLLQIFYQSNTQHDIVHKLMNAFRYESLL